MKEYMAETPESKALRAETCIYRMLQNNLELVDTMWMTTFQLPHDFQHMVDLGELDFFVSATEQAIYNIVSIDMLNNFPKEWEQKQILLFAEIVARTTVTFIRKAVDTLDVKSLGSGIISLGFDAPFEGKTVNSSVGLTRQIIPERRERQTLYLSELVYSYTETGWLITDKKD